MEKLPNKKYRNFVRVEATGMKETLYWDTLYINRRFWKPLIVPSFTLYRTKVRVRAMAMKQTPLYLVHSVYY